MSNEVLNNNTMSDEEYVRQFGTLYNQVMNLKDDKDYVINAPQMEKLVKVLGFFIDEAKKQDGKVEPLSLSPREEHGGVTATFLVFDIYGDTVKRFCDVMRECSALGIDTCKDGACISCTIPNVFVPAKK